MKKLLSVLLVLMMALSVASAENMGGLTSFFSAEEEETLYAPGQTAVLDGYEVRLINIMTSEGGAVYTPAEGNQYIIFEFEITNHKPEQTVVSAMLSFSAEVDGSPCEWSAEASATAMMSGKYQFDAVVAPDQTASGIVGYEVPADWSDIRISVKPDFNVEASVTYQVRQLSGRGASEKPAARPTEEPTAEPTEEPTPEPTEEPTPEPTEEPTPEPTEEPTPEPTAEPTSEPTPEPVEPVAVYEQDGHLYALFDRGGMTWLDAEAFCESNGGHLACIGSTEEQAVIDALLDRGTLGLYWLGGRRSVSGEFVWADGSEMNYLNWGPGSPDNYLGIEDFMQVLRTANPEIQGSVAHSWNDAPVNSTVAGSTFFYPENVGFIAEWDQHEHTYTVVDGGNLNWEEACIACWNMGGYLACVNDAEEQAQLEALIASGSKGMYWLGGYRGDNGNLGWLDGAPMDYTNWDSGAPDNHAGVEHYVQILRVANPENGASAAGKWNDAPIDNTVAGSTFFQRGNVGYICEMDAMPWERQIEQVPGSVSTPRPAPQPTATPVPKAVETARVIVQTAEPVSVLQKGSKGEEVKRLQQRLKELNYLSGSADGDYGNATASAVSAFQQEVNLPVTGVADEATQKALYNPNAPRAKVYTTLDYKAVARDPNAYTGNLITFKGKIVQVMESGNVVAFRIATRRGYDDVVYCMYIAPDNYSRFLEDDRVIVYGVCTGVYTYETVLGSSITIPSCDIDRIELQ